MGLVRMVRGSRMVRATAKSESYVGERSGESDCERLRPRSGQ